MEVVGGVNATVRSAGGNGGIAGGVRSKIRHHGAVKASQYSGGGNMSGAGVPMRLSASEVDQGDSDEDNIRGDVNGRYHVRNGSGRSSLNSGPRVMSYAGQSGGLHSANHGGRLSNGSTPPSGASYSPVEGPAINNHPRSHSNPQMLPSPDSDDPQETPMPDMYASHGDYFEQAGSNGQGGSGSSEERGFGSVSGLPQRRQQQQDETKMKSSDELRRRGSVDDRTMTMSTGRLFVANPDLSD